MPFSAFSARRGDSLAELHDKTRVDQEFTDPGYAQMLDVYCAYIIRVQHRILPYFIIVGRWLFWVEHSGRLWRS